MSTSKEVRKDRAKVAETQFTQDGEELQQQTLRIPVHMHKALKHMAVDEGRTVTEIVTTLIRDHIICAPTQHPKK